MTAGPLPTSLAPTMSPRLLSAWRSGAGLTRQFAVLSLIVTALITAALSWVLTRALRADLLEREWAVTADFIRTEAFFHLGPADFVAPPTPAAAERFRAFYKQTAMLPEIVRVKIYDADMAVVWSDESRLVGQRFPDNPHLARAIAGRTTVNIKPRGERTGENVYEGETSASLVEVYVPIVFPGRSGVAGVVETYKVPAQVFANIRRGQLTVVTTALAGGAFLYLSLIWIVRRAARRIDEQHAALDHRNRELRAVQAQLLEAERLAAIGEVVAAVAHGIRNPLANIRASAQVATLDRQDPGDPTTRHLTNVMSEVDRLETRLRQLLQFVRPAEPREERLDVNAVLRGAVELTAARIAARGLAVDERLDPQLPHVRGDAMLLEQVFLSLLGNAVEAMVGEDGAITLTTGVEPDGAGGHQVFAEVRDSGPGIPPEELGRIFKPFYTTKAQGTGLGLAVAKKFAEGLGGSVGVDTAPGKGSAFRVTLPVPLEHK